MKLFDVYPINPIEIVKGVGSYVYDATGREYLDLYGGHAVISIGHSHPHYIQRITDQLNKIGFYSNSIEIPLQKQLAELLGKVSDKKDYQLFLCNSGAEANENALKLASFYNGRKKVIAFKGAFHGRTSLAVSATDNPKIIAPVNETENVIFLPFNDEDALEKIFAEQGEAISSVIIEGIQGVGGIRVANHSFLQKIRSLTEQYNAIFIADSVQCGYGRSGKFYSHDHANVQADIYSMAKGMGNGFPIGAISISPKIKPWFGELGTTFGGNHLACVAALAVLETMEKEQLVQNALQIGRYLMSELKGFDKIKEIRGEGLMIGIELPEELNQVKKDLLFKNHIFTGEAKPNVIRLLPALNLGKKEADRFLEALSERLRSYK
ncbi:MULTISPECIES: aspartate aminotransferase family protein [Olivibacter]|uniref:Acetylornithine transaminase n=3 Tax=Sphingobacteriaceae TaxID=84566 RepID=F4CCS1_SPHS2|nr:MULTISPECIES: aminotransferase class III-fold pyridoxal phosphate-dependent enzyme [Olivibacter]MCL4642159.1 aminotransferase class III-fold pyridoxal phosphate-dependent enzyme [Olivibacter sp. UJ_SKK_5.1]MDM8177674.1 aminotransferase class III-fold pyridoxal phosphate-dependent enzyme [Olivibacter sp. 47]MDX3911900.1 aminotransferase class III-fold pyridoxal phosphate-dependent enzyme [Pseudosphingobacterium sp.]QEK99647.1 aspartate aminotransferase family protein [Olivibacter sp. LS-1]